MPETPSSEIISTKQRRIAELAKSMPGAALSTLAHHMDIAWLKAAYQRTRKDGARGVDGQSAEQYAANLEVNLQSLLDRAKSGTYRAPPVRRVEIPKGDGNTRPLGIPTFEDKILQRAVAMLLEPIYEEEFKPYSYGFRPGRSAHQALEALRQQAMDLGGCWILEVDIRKFFDTLDHGHLRDILQQRIRDGVVVRLIGKWLNAGVLEKGELSYPEAGTPQGGVISPLLANIYLHTVLDAWFDSEVKPRLKGSCFLIRYADDFVIGFEEESDARRVMAVLPKRFERFGLAIHPDKTRLVQFQRPSDQDGSAAPGSFDLLGFTHHWARSRRGAWVIKRKTSSKRLTRALQAVRDWCAKHFHDPVRKQWRALDKKLKGHYGYYGITGNADAIGRFRTQVGHIWKRALGRRSQRGYLTKAAFKALTDRFPLPGAKVVHSIYARP